MTTSPSRDRDLAGVAPPAFGILITADAFAALLQVSKRTLFRLRAKGVLPTPVEISTNTIRWRTADVTDYLKNLRTRKARRPNGK
jgi:predicted DNA-binding transcriptional regulator AlpA